MSEIPELPAPDATDKTPPKPPEERKRTPEEEAAIERRIERIRKAARELERAYRSAGGTV